MPLGHVQRQSNMQGIKRTREPIENPLAFKRKSRALTGWASKSIHMASDIKNILVKVATCPVCKARCQACRTTFDVVLSLLC